MNKTVINSDEEVQAIFAEILKEITPNREKILKEVESFTKKIEAELKKAKVNAKLLVGGSVAKNTNLKDSSDCDIFIRFDYETYKEEDISSILKKVLSPFKPELVHGSRDYFQITGSIDYEIVPVLDVEDPNLALNTTDMSPLHVDWVSAHPKMADEIRLVKQFCKAQRVYGAESFIGGFSGHVIDILTIYYGGFLELLEASEKWVRRIVIDPEKFYASSDQAIKVLNRAKLDSPLIVIDPVFKKRNAAAALTEEQYDRFKLSALAFLSCPSKDYFIVKEISPKILFEKYGTDLIIVSATPLVGKTDVIGGKLMKLFKLIRNQLNFYDFNVAFSDWVWDKKNPAILWFATEKKKLIPLTKQVGPPLSVEDNVNMFKEKHPKTFVENNRICSYVNRKYVAIFDLLKDVVNSPDAKDKAKKILVIRPAKVLKDQVTKK